MRSDHRWFQQPNVEWTRKGEDAREEQHMRRKEDWNGVL